MLSVVIITGSSVDHPLGGPAEGTDASPRLPPRGSQPLDRLDFFPGLPPMLEEVGGRLGRLLALVDELQQRHAAASRAAAASGRRVAASKGSDGDSDSSSDREDDSLEAAAAARRPPGKKLQWADGPADGEAVGSGAGAAAEEEKEEEAWGGRGRWNGCSRCRCCCRCCCCCCRGERASAAQGLPAAHPGGPRLAGRRGLCPGGAGDGVGSGPCVCADGEHAPRCSRCTHPGAILVDCA